MRSYCTEKRCRLLRSEKGQAVAEAAVVLLIVVALVEAMLFFGNMGDALLQAEIDARNNAWLDQSRAANAESWSEAIDMDDNMISGVFSMFMKIINNIMNAVNQTSMGRSTATTTQTLGGNSVSFNRTVYVDMHTWSVGDVMDQIRGMLWGDAKNQDSGLRRIDGKFGQVEDGRSR